MCNVCAPSLTNRGPAFTKGMDDPTEVKAAMIDRSIALFVRTLGVKTHSDDEFLAHLQEQEVKRRLCIFRIFTCLVALVRMFIYRNPAFAPDMALAQKMWDEWDNGENGLDQGYGLPKPSPRKNMKRTENCVTMTVVKAVAEVFLYKNVRPAPRLHPAVPCCLPACVSVGHRPHTSLSAPRWTMTATLSPFT